MHRIPGRFATMPFRITVSLLSVLLVVAACSSDDSTAPKPEPTTTQSQDATPPTKDTTDVIRPTPDGNAPTEEPAPKSSFDADGDGWMTWDEVNTAVRSTFPTYEWPNAYTTDVETLLTWREAITNSNGQDVSNTNFQSGIEHSLPGEANVCAWTFNWLDAYAEGNQIKMDTSMEHIDALVSDLWSLSGIRTDLEIMLNQAILGDISGLQQFSTMFCDRSVFSQSLRNPPEWIESTSLVYGVARSSQVSHQHVGSPHLKGKSP